MGAMYAFVRVNGSLTNGFDDEQFALDLLQQKHVLIAPGRSFNVDYHTHFRTTLLPESPLMKHVLAMIEELLDEYADG
jgi:alanine-synthesizing transaminase